MIRRALAKLRRLAAAPTARADTPDLERLLRLVDEKGHPNVNPLWALAKDLEATRLNVKMLGYAMAGALEHRLQQTPVEPQGPFLLDSKACTQGDIESRWFRYWCERLQERPRFHRRLWDLCYVMQALHAGDALRPGARALCLGAQQQPAPSVLANLGAEVIVAQDQSEPVPGKEDHEPLMDGRYTDRPTFLTRVRRRPLDFGRLDGLEGFDALWSLGLANHLGSIVKGQDLVRNAMKALKPGGVAVHVVDYNFADDERTPDDWSHVLFQRRHIEAMAAALKADGHEVSPLDFNPGFQEMDRFIDLPPYDTGRTPAFDRLWRDGWQAAHLKMMVDGFAVTSFGIVVRKAR